MVTQKPGVKGSDPPQEHNTPNFRVIRGVKHPVHGPLKVYKIIYCGPSSKLQVGLKIQ